MAKVLIVDDEPIAVEAVEFMIKKNFEAIKQIEKSRSGKEAIEKSYHFHPDIIIMDINMPGINGLEAMRQIRTTNHEASFIVISAFDYFDYAVEAVALGVEDYLLKPVKEAKFIETFQKVLGNVEQNNKKRKQSLEQMERFEKIVPIMETGFMNALCMYGQDTSQLQNYCDLFGYQNTGGYCLVMEFGQKNNILIENKIGAGIHGEKMYEEYKKIIKGCGNCIVSPIMLNRIIAYVFEEGEEDYEQKAKSVKTAGRIIERAAKIYPDIFIGIGNYHKDINYAKKSYQEAVHALRIMPVINTMVESLDSHILHADDIIENKEGLDNDYEQLTETEIYAQISENNNDDAVRISFSQLYERMCMDPNIDFEAIKKWMIGLVIGFEKRWDKVLNNSYYKILDEILSAKDEEALFQIGNIYIGHTTKQILSSRQKKVNSIIEKANQYITEHFNEDITLDELAKHVNLSSYYFSRFYKNSTGTSFSDKMVILRMDKAKELLKREDLSIKDVSYMVGYVDPNYFSKIFKKVTGYNASEFKKMNGL